MSELMKQSSDFVALSARGFHVTASFNKYVARSM